MSDLVESGKWKIKSIRKVHGFALLISVVLVLILTIFAYWMLLLAEKHYLASHLLFDNQNARIAAEAAATEFVLQHNLTTPRFFIDPNRWSGLDLKPLQWNGYNINGKLDVPWSAIQTNLLHLQIRRKRSFSQLDLPLRQLRFEDFALYAEGSHAFSTSSLFDGALFVRGGLTLNEPVRFREPVHGDVTPEYFASYRKQSSVKLEFPVFELPKWPGGLTITSRALPFWNADHYELDLDRISISRMEDQWQIRYHGNIVGEAAQLVLTFDGPLHISQSFRAIPHIPSGKPEATLYIVSSDTVLINGNIQSFESANYHHSIFTHSQKSIAVSGQRTAIRIDACLWSPEGIQLSPGTIPLTVADHEIWIGEINSSAFVVEPQARAALLEALNNKQKIVWFRGSIATGGAINTPPDLQQLHYEACRRVHDLIPSLPFVEIVEGRQRWL